MNTKAISGIVTLLCATTVMAQVSVQTGNGRVTVGKEVNINVQAQDVTTITTGGNTSSVNVGSIEGDANIHGVTVINGKVWIDGKEIPPKVTRYKSKSGTVYLIRRNGGAVEVTSE